MRQLSFSGGRSFAGMPKVSIDPAIRVPDGRYHSAGTPVPDSPSMVHMAIAFQLARMVLKKMKPVWEHLEVVKVLFHLGDDDPTTVFVRCEIVMVEPLTREKWTFSQYTTVLWKDSNPRTSHSVAARLKLLSDGLLEDVHVHLARRSLEFHGLVLKVRKLHEAFV